MMVLPRPGPASGHLRPGASISESEPNNTPGTANAIPPGTEYVTGAVSPLGDHDYFSFAGSVGDLVFASLDTSASTDSDTTLTLLDTDGVTVVESDKDDGPNGLSSGIAGATLPSTGTFYLLVQGAGDGHVIDPYTLYLGVVPPTPVSWEAEPNENPAQATQASALNKGYIWWPPGEEDHWWFEARVGDTLFIGMDNDPDENGFGSANFFFELLDPAGGSVAVADNDSSSFDEAEFLGLPSLTATGAYTVRVADSTGQAAGQEGLYHLAIFVNGRPLPLRLAVNKVRIQPPDGVTVTGEQVIFEIGITNNSLDSIVLLPLLDTYAPSFLAYVSASPQPDDNVNDGLINWTDLTGPSPGGFGADLGPGNTFTVTAIFEAFAPTVLATSTANTARVEGAKDSSGRTLDPAQSSAPLIILQGPAATSNTITGDVNFDCAVNLVDVQKIASRWGYARGQFGFWPGWDLNDDGVVDGGDTRVGAGAWRDVLQGDVDANRIVTASDLQALTSRWGQSTNDPRYDLNGDGVVTIQDIQIAGSYWRKGC